MILLLFSNLVILLTTLQIQLNVTFHTGAKIKTLHKTYL